jgi:FMN phosphatase YigB (HAD superfamily)
MSASGRRIRAARRLLLADCCLSAAADCVVFCGDVGWRKPAPEIFQFAAERLGVSCSNTAFVGDDLKWDIQGSEAVGMRAVLIDRDNRHPEYDGNRILQLRGIEELLSDV